MFFPLRRSRAALTAIISATQRPDDQLLKFSLLSTRRSLSILFLPFPSSLLIRDRQCGESCPHDRKSGTLAPLLFFSKEVRGTDVISSPAVQAKFSEHFARLGPLFAASSTLHCRRNR